MGLKPDEVKALTFVDYVYMIIGHMRRQDAKMVFHRQLLHGMYKFSGLGKKKRLKDSDFGELHSERMNQKKHIKTKKQAGDLVKRFNNADTST